MGNCFSTNKDPTALMLKHANKTFSKIDKEKKQFIETEDLTKYFGTYAKTATKIIMREMDLNQDGKITRSQWIGYWEYVRRAGYKISQIQKQLDNIDSCRLNLDFSNAKEYESTQPRQTLVQTIIEDVRRTHPDLPFTLQKS